MANRRVFISYSREDKPRVDSLIQALADKKIEYWADQEIRAGEEWEQAIESALHSASIFVFFISPDFLASKWAMFEIGLALSKARQTGAVIVPVLLRRTVLPEYIQQFQSIDAASLKPSEFADKVQSIMESKAA